MLSFAQSPVKVQELQQMLDLTTDRATERAFGLGLLTNAVAAATAETAQKTNEGQDSLHGFANTIR